jgi:hypothetical protein
MAKSSRGLFRLPKCGRARVELGNSRASFLTRAYLARFDLLGEGGYSGPDIPPKPPLLPARRATKLEAQPLFGFSALNFQP